MNLEAILKAVSAIPKLISAVTKAWKWLLKKLPWISTPQFSWWFKRITFAIAIFLPSGMFVWSAMTVEGQLIAPLELRQGSQMKVIVFKKDKGGNSIREVEIVMPIESEGRFSFHTWPGDYAFMFIHRNGSTLRYSISARKKHWYSFRETFQFDSQTMASQVITVDRFGFDSSAVPPDCRTRMSQSLTKGSADSFFLIIGHTDKVGSDGYNHALGQKRARSGAIELNALGVPMNHIYIGSFGCKCPALRVDSTNDDGVERWIEAFRIPDPFGSPE